MSTIFGHGRLRLYLLKLLDESPRHGYEIISLLRDRFLGVYSPSPGTIYPRLARLEEEGLVTHTEEGGRKVYSLTDKGRAELRDRSGDLDDLEREITDSVRDVARAVKQDVRATISSLREELKFAAGGARRPEPTAGATSAERDAGPAGQAPPSSEGADAPAAGPSAPGGASDPGPGQGTGATSADDGGERDRSGEPGCEDGSRWAREWERFAQGFGAFGAVWGRGESERRPEGPEFDRALRDFSDRVRDVVREAGNVGEAAAHDLRRILDDTVEVIRRDVRHWGPTGGGSTDAGDAEGAARPTEEPGPADTPADTPADPADTPTARPTAGEAAGDGEGPTPPAAGGDPWSAAVGEPAADQEPGSGGDAATGDTAPGDAAGSAPPVDGSDAVDDTPAAPTGPADDTPTDRPADTWGTAVRDGEDDQPRQGPAGQ